MQRTTDYFEAFSRFEAFSHLLFLLFLVLATSRQRDFLSLVFPSSLFFFFYLFLFSILSLMNLVFIFFFFAIFLWNISRKSEFIVDISTSFDISPIYRQYYGHNNEISSNRLSFAYFISVSTNIRYIVDISVNVSDFLIHCIIYSNYFLNR